jgi:hypothetical protein
MPGDEYDDLLDSFAPKRRAPAAPVSHLPDLISFAQENNLRVGSTTGGTHNRNSRHYTGNAIDIRDSGAWSDEQVSSLTQQAAERGFLVRDERRRPPGQPVWGGPHVHLEYAGNAAQRDPYDALLDGMASPKATPQQGDDYDQLLDEVATPSQPQLKTPQVTSRVVDDTGEEIRPSAFKPLGFQAGEFPAQDQRLAGVEELTARKYRESPPPSQALGGVVTAKLPANKGGAPDAIAEAVLSHYGPQFVDLNNLYKQATGRNIISVNDVKLDREGNFSFTPSKNAIDFVNAFGQGVSEGGVEEGLKRATAVNVAAIGERARAINAARAAAAPDIKEALAGLRRAKDSPVLRGMIQGTAPVAQQYGSLIPGQLGDELLRQAAVERAISQQAEMDQPLTTTGEQIKAGLGAAVPAAMNLATTAPLRGAQLPVLGALQGTTPEERLRGGLEGAAMQGAFAGIPKAFSNLPKTGTAVTAGAMVGMPATEAYQRGESPIKAIAENLPFAALPLLHGGRAEAERPIKDVLKTTEGGYRRWVSSDRLSEEIRAGLAQDGEVILESPSGRQIRYTASRQKAQLPKAVDTRRPEDFLPSFFGVKPAEPAKPVEQGVAAPAKPVEAQVVKPYEMTRDQAAAVVPEVGFGPGAASVGDVPEGSVTRQLTEAIKNSDAAPRDRISLSLNLADKVSAGKDAIERGLIKSKALTESLWAKYKGKTDVAADQRILGDFQYKLQKSAFETRKFAKTIAKKLSPAQQEYITNYIQAEGNTDVLKQRAEMTRPGPTKAGYRRAATLTNEEKTIAAQFSSAFESLFKEANESGVGVSFVENYVPQIWGERTKASKVMLADAQRGMLDPTFRFSRRRIFESYFEGEQASYKPKTKSIGALYQVYANALNKAIASRQYIEDLQNAKASDGRPLVAIRGAAQTPLTEGPLAQEKGAFVKPHRATADTSDYRVLNHPAMRGWKYVTSIDGKPVMLEGDMAIHPEAFNKIRNVLTPSKIATGEGLPYKAIRAVKKGQSIAKQTMLGFFSPFHQLQEDVHALGHKTLPYINKTKIDFDDPTQQRLLKGGLQVVSFNEAEAFSEGLAGGNLTAKIPIVGTKLLGPYQEWLFKDHIPNLKMNMALHALERNTKRYEGKLSPERIAELTASQANNAFGELNYAYMGRNQTFQDSLRILLLAPDFLEARAKFAGSALKGQGREQLNALLLLAATQYVTARVLNKLSDDDYHWEHQNAFVVVHQGKTYGLRSVPSDILELAEDPRRFLTNRSSPLTAAGIRAYTGKNEFGRPVDLMDQAKLIAQSPVPIQLKGLFYKKDMNLWDSFFSSMGIRVAKDKRNDKTQKTSKRKGTQ